MERILFSRVETALTVYDYATARHLAELLCSLVSSSQRKHDQPAGFFVPFNGNGNGCGHTAAAAAAEDDVLDDNQQQHSLAAAAAAAAATAATAATNQVGGGTSAAVMSDLATTTATRSPKPSAIPVRGGGGAGAAGTAQNPRASAGAGSFTKTSTAASHTRRPSSISRLPQRQHQHELTRRTMASWFQARHLLGRVFFQSGNVHGACSVLKNNPLPAARYLYARACFQLRQFGNAEMALLSIPDTSFVAGSAAQPPLSQRHYNQKRGGSTAAMAQQHQNLHQWDDALANGASLSSRPGGDGTVAAVLVQGRLSDEFKNVPQGAAGMLLLGNIYRRSGRRDRAERCFRQCLALDSFMWAAYEALCDLGVDVDAYRVTFLDAHVASMLRAAHSMTQQTSFAQQANSARSAGSGAPGLTTGTAQGTSTVPETPLAPFDIRVTTPKVTLFGTPAEQGDQAKQQQQEHFALPGPDVESTPLMVPKTSDHMDSFVTPPAPPQDGRNISMEFLVQRRGTAKARHTRTRSRVSQGSMGSDVSTALSGAASTGAISLPRTRRSARLAEQGKQLVSSAAKQQQDNDVTMTMTPRSMSSAAVAGNEPAIVVRSKARTSPSTNIPRRVAAPKKRAGGGHGRKAPGTVARSHRRAATGIMSGSVVTSGGDERGSAWTTPSGTFGSSMKRGRSGSNSTNGGGQHIVGASVETPAFDDALASLAPTVSVFRRMAKAYALQTCFQCKEALDIYRSLPYGQRIMNWTLCQMGRCHFQRVQYEAAVEFFTQARKVEPLAVRGMDIFSTCLWHLKREVELSFLAQELVEGDRSRPETWIAMGNCFSLQKEHETALKFFNRAVQVDPDCAYAHTLSAHEYVTNEDFDKALVGYRNAIGIDDRHYNAWYGMGSIYYRQEKYGLASYHFSRALSINPRSSVLHCYLGMVLHASKRYSEALKMFDDADQLEPTNPLAKFQKANVYYSMESYELALRELQSVKDFAPREASVHFLMGKVHKKLGQLDKAMLRFTTALDLNPKDRHLVKSAIDRLHVYRGGAQRGDDDADDGQGGGAEDLLMGDSGSDLEF